MSGLYVLPLEQKPHQIGGAHRLDLGPKPPDRIPVNAGQETAIAPLALRPTGSERTPQDRALRLESQQGSLRFGSWDPELLGQPPSRDGPLDAEPSAKELADGFLSGRRDRRQLGRQLQLGIRQRVRQRGPQLG